MKTRIVILVAILSIITVYPAIASGQDTTVTVGNETYVLVNAGTGGAAEYPRQHVTAYADTMFPYYGPVNPKHHQWVPLHGDLVIHPEMLDSYDTVESWLQKAKWTKNFQMPERSGKMYRLHAKPNSVNDITIFTLELRSEHGGIPSYTEWILLSLGWPLTHSYRFYSEIYLDSEPVAKGISVGSGGTSAKAENNSEGYSYTVNPLLGVAWTELKIPYTVRISFCNDGDVWLYDPTKVPSVQPATHRMKIDEKIVPPEQIAWIFFNTNKYNIRNDQFSSVDQVVNYIITYWDELIRMGHVIIFDGHCDIRFDKKYNDWLGAQRAEAVMNKAKEILIAKGYPEQILEKMLLAKSSGWRVSSSKLNHDDRRVEVFRAKPLSTMPEKGNTAS